MLYVDDLLIVGNHVQKIEWIKQLHKKFDMSNLWQMRYYLHIEFVHLENFLWPMKINYQNSNKIQHG